MKLGQIFRIIRFACCFVWLPGLVFYFEGRTYIIGKRKGSADDIPGPKKDEVNNLCINKLTHIT